MSFPSDALRQVMADWSDVTDDRCPACGKRVDVTRTYGGLGSGRHGHGSQHTDGELAEMVLFMENETEIHVDVLHETMTSNGDVPEYIGPGGRPSALDLAFAIADGDRMCPLVFTKNLSLRGFVAQQMLTRKEAAP